MPSASLRSWASTPRELQLPALSAPLRRARGPCPGRAAPRGKKGKSDTPTLSQFGRDLTAMAAEGKLDPVIGRSKEIERVIQILTRRTKNNPCLIGEPGVGKTAIAEGLAQKIVDGRGAGAAARTNGWLPWI